MDRRLSPRYFLADEPLVSTRIQTVSGHEVQPGGDIPADLEYGIRLKLWMSGRAKYRKDYSPSPVTDQDEAEQPGEASGAAMAEVGSNGYYEITAPWLDEPIKVRGKNKAEAILADIQRKGDPGAKTEQSQDGGEGDQVPTTADDDAGDAGEGDQTGEDAGE